MEFRYSLLKSTIYFIYHSRKLIAYICKYIYYKFAYNSKYLITYNYGNSKIIKKNLENYSAEDAISLVRTKKDNIVLYHRILFSNNINNNLDTSNHNILSVAIKFNNKEYDFNIEPFSVINNKILDKVFVYWYLKYKYKLECNDNYLISIIDNDINTYNVDKNQYVLLTKDTFIIKTI